MPALRIKQKKPGCFWLCDLLFLLCSISYAMLAYQGILPVSSRGAQIDSDLATYAQGMAGEAHPELFQSDPVLSRKTQANSIPNVERMIATALAPVDEPAIGLLRAGAIAIFFFYAGWYMLGRWLFTSPALAAILALVCGITVWIGWGTFWGITHSDPVPRVFFAAIFPFLLLLATYAARAAWLRPLAACAAGCCMWVHGISALNCGAMFLTAFLLIRPKDASLGSHLWNTFFCALFFLTPVLIYLWPSISQSRSFSAEELAIFRDMFDLRWANDYSSFWPRFKKFLSLSNPPVPIILFGLAGWLATKFYGNPREKTLCLLHPGFIFALIIMVIFCWAETRYAPELGRLPMGHELVRGLRFLVPLSWTFIVACGGLLITGKWPRRAVLLILICAISIFTVDRQYVAVQYAIETELGLRLPRNQLARKWKDESDAYRALLEKIKNTVPPGEAIFSAEDDMGIRYISQRPLIHTFKDGYVFFYNKDLEGCSNWLHYENILNKPHGLVEAWLESGAPWLLRREKDDAPGLEKHAVPVLKDNGWLLARRKTAADANY